VLRRRPGEAHRAIFREGEAQVLVGDRGERVRVQAALGQPDAARPDTERALVRLDRLTHLRAQHVRVLQDGREPVGGGAGHHLDAARLVVLGEGARQIAADPVVARLGVLRLLAREQRGFAERVIVADGAEVALAQRAPRVEVAVGALAQAGRRHHRQERR